MVEEYKKAEEERKKGHKKGGRKPKLCEDIVPSSIHCH